VHLLTHTGKTSLASSLAFTRPGSNEQLLWQFPPFLLSQCFCEVTLELPLHCLLTNIGLLLQASLRGAVHSPPLPANRPQGMASVAQAWLSSASHWSPAHEAGSEASAGSHTTTSSLSFGPPKIAVRGTLKSVQAANQTGSVQVSCFFHSQSKARQTWISWSLTSIQTTL